MQRVAAVCAILTLPCASRALAWDYPEHREIALYAIETLDPPRRRAFDELWGAAQATSARLCERGADTEQTTAPDCIDWAAFSAIAGDHSCSAAEALQVVMEEDWILEVADVGAQLGIDLSAIEVRPLPDQEGALENPFADAERQLADQAVRAARINVLRTADTRLQRADPRYATRAASNHAHFLLPRPTVETDADGYNRLALEPGSPINAMGVYGWYHLRALEKAKRLAQGDLTPEERATYARSMLVDEAFGLHFLEDMFAAGHVAGSWGDASQRKGTHDHYNELGFEAAIWGREGPGVVLMGDAHMLPENRAVAAAALRRSLRQVLDTAAGGPEAADFELEADVPMAADRFDVCEAAVMPSPEPGWLRGPDVKEPLRGVLRRTPVPGLGPGRGAQPRFRAEVGPFVGLIAALDGRGTLNGFTPGQGSAGIIGGLDIAARVGFGLDGVMGESGDGLVFVDVGLRADTASTSAVDDSPENEFFGNIAAAVPSRLALSTRFRMPFYLVPGDLLLLSPLYLVSPETYTQMAVTAGNGGLLPWQAGFATSFGRFQLVPGRELGMSYYGLIGSKDRLLVPYGPGDARLVDLNSILFEVPFLEYRPYRAFSSHQSSEVLFQLFFAADVPTGVDTVVPPAVETDLQTIWSLGLRFSYDWRYYP